MKEKRIIPSKMPNSKKKLPNFKRNPDRSRVRDRRPGYISFKSTFIVLALTAILATVGGYFVITQCDFWPLDLSAPPTVVGAYGSQNQFFTSLPELTAPTAMAAGRDDTLFVSEGASIRCYELQFARRSSVTLRLLWKRDFESTVTAMHFVEEEEKVLQGMLLVGLGNKIESVNPNQKDGGGVLFAELQDNSIVTSIATNSNAVFAADKPNNIIVKYDMLGNKIQDIGSKEGADGFAGFDLGEAPTFCIDCVRNPSVLLAANPAKSRVETFDAETGAWDREHSWDKSPDRQGGFAPGNNPYYLTVLLNQTVMTVETGKNARIRNFNLDGDLLLEFEDPFPTDSSKTQSPPMVSIGRVVGGTGYAIFLLSCDGQLFINILGG